MAFFEPAPPPPEPEEPEQVHEPWWGPPRDALGAVLPIGRFCVRAEHVVLTLTHTTVYPAGCVLHVAGALRRADLAEEWWSAMQDAAFGPHFHLGRRHGLPDELRRFGVRYPDGAKATTVEQPPGDGSMPIGPILTEAGGGTGGGSQHMIQCHQDLWLWPLPPPVPFDFAVEWPVAGVSLTITELDGAAINAAARNSRPYWEQDRQAD